MQVSIISNADGTLEKIEPVKLPNGAIVEEFQVVILFIEQLKSQINCLVKHFHLPSLQVGSTPNGSAVGDSLIEKADDGGQKLSTESVEFSSSSGMMNGCIHLKTPDCNSHRELKKKHMKRRMRSMYLVPNNLFRASLSLHKKKHRRSKRHTSDIKNLTQDQLLEAGCVSVGQDPSTSDKTQTVSVGPTNPRVRRIKHGTIKVRDKKAAGKDVKTSNGECVMDNVDVSFRDRIDQEGAILATDKEPQKSSSSVGKQWDPQRSDSLSDSKRDQLQNGLMSILTRGLDETIGKCLSGTWADFFFFRHMLF